MDRGTGSPWNPAASVGLSNRAPCRARMDPGTLPRTSSGKLRRGEALRQLQAGELRPPDRVTVLHVARETARSLLARLRG